MKIEVITNPDRKITQSVLFFQFQFMGWTHEDLIDLDDRYGSVPFGYVVCYNNNDLVGSINLHKRKIKFQNKEILLGGIGGVCVHTNFRHQDIASNLLKEGMNVLRENKCDIAFLCTNIKKLSPLYSPFGFVPLNREYRSTGLSGKIYTDEGGMIASINSKHIFENILQMSEPFDLDGQDW